MNANHIFVDTNVLIGSLSGNVADTRCLQYLYSLKGKRLYVSSLSIAQLVALFQKRKTDIDLRKAVKYILTKFNVVSFTEKDIAHSLDISDGDMEDNMQFVISQKMKCLHFITNNIKDYTCFYTINIVRPSSVRRINQ